MLIYKKNNFECKINILKKQAQKYIFNHISDLIAFNFYFLVVGNFCNNANERKI